MAGSRATGFPESHIALGCPLFELANTVGRIVRDPVPLLASDGEHVGKAREVAIDGARLPGEPLGLTALDDPLARRTTRSEVLVLARD